MYRDIYETVLNNVLPKSGEYPVALKGIEKLLIKEQSELVPIYFDSFVLTGAELRADLEEKAGNPTGAEAAIQFAVNEINTCRGSLENLVYGMDNYGDDGYPNLMVLTDDLNSKKPAISYSSDPEYNFEIKPKNFRLGLTGRVLEDQYGKKYEEALAIGLDIYDAFNFAKKIRPESICGVNKNGETIILYNNPEILGDNVEMAFPQKKRYVMNEFEEGRWMGETEVLPTGGLKIMPYDFYKRMGNHNVFLVGHKGNDIDTFLAQALTSDFLIWKICQKKKHDLNTPLIDADPYYGDYKGQPRYEDKNRLQYLPSNASLWFDGSGISFDNETSMRVLMEQGDLIRDIWCEPLDRKRKGWDIVYDRSRVILPENPLAVLKREDFKNFHVLKEDNYIMPEFELLGKWSL